MPSVTTNSNPDWTVRTTFAFCVATRPRQAACGRTSTRMLLRNPCHMLCCWPRRAFESYLLDILDETEGARPIHIVVAGRLCGPSCLGYSVAPISLLAGGPCCFVFLFPCAFSNGAFYIEPRRKAMREFRRNAFVDRPRARRYDDRIQEGTSASSGRRRRSVGLFRRSRKRVAAVVFSCFPVLHRHTFSIRGTMPCGISSCWWPCCFR